MKEGRRENRLQVFKTLFPETLSQISRSSCFSVRLCQFSFAARRGSPRCLSQPSSAACHGFGMAMGSWLISWAVKKPSQCLNTEALPSTSMVLSKGRSEFEGYRLCFQCVGHLEPQRVHSTSPTPGCAWALRGLASLATIGVGMQTQRVLLRARLRAHSINTVSLMGKKCEPSFGTSPPPCSCLGQLRQRHTAQLAELNPLHARLHRLWVCFISLLLHLVPY